MSSYVLVSTNPFILIAEVVFFLSAILPRPLLKAQAVSRLFCVPLLHLMKKERSCKKYIFFFSAFHCWIYACMCSWETSINMDLVAVVVRKANKTG